MKSYLDAAMEMKETIIKDRRYLHTNPELVLELVNTAQYVTNRLQEMGYSPKRVGECGVVATVGNKQGKVILLRADMDALPIQETSGLPFASVCDGKAHCCGHDNHTAMLLGAAKLLKENEESLQGTVKLMFQPGEETLQGARSMIEGGVLESPTVDSAFALHVNALLKCGQIFVGSGAVSSSSDKFEVVIEGHGSHASRPHEAIDPINVATFIYSALMELQAHEIPRQEFVVLSIGCIKAGEVGNAIPDTAIMKGSLRTYSQEVRTMVMERITTISEKIAESFRAKATVNFMPNYTVSLVADDGVATQATSSIAALLGEKRVRKMSQKNSASEDFAFITQRVPGTMAIIGAAISDNVEFGQHNPSVVFNEECLPVGAAVYAQVATEWLKNNKSEDKL